MRVYCKCLNIEVAIFASECKARSWKAIALDSEDDDLPQEIDHEAFQGDVFHFIAKATNELALRQDDIIHRRKRIQEEKDFFSTVVVHAYLPHLVVTHRLLNWRVRECFLCRTAVMACLNRGLSIVCPAGLFGTSLEDNLFSALNAGSARLWMFAREALSVPSRPLASSVLQSLSARQRLEAMNQVWRVAQTRAQRELELRLEALRRQELAAFEEEARLAKEMQLQVANVYYGLLSMLSTDPKLFVEAEEEEEKEKERRREEERKMREKARKSEADMRTGGFSAASGDSRSVLGRSPLDEVEVATEALDLYETDLFDDGPRPGGPAEDVDDEDSYISAASGRDRGKRGDARKSGGNRGDSAEKDEGDEPSAELLSTSAISSSIQARMGMRANIRSRDDRLPDADAFNAMTDAERTYAIEKASYQMQDNRLHEIYGDMEPPFLQELRRQAERTRHNPAPALEEEATTATTTKQDSPL